MSSLWIGNFSFEDQLQGRNQPSAIVRRFEAELAPCLAGAAASGDMILCPEAVDELFTDQLNQLGTEPPEFLSSEDIRQRADEIAAIEPWGWSPAVHQFVQKLGDFPHPSFETVATANSRQFSLQIARKLGCHLTAECEIRELESLTSELTTKRYRDGFVIKSNFGQSGRGQIISSNRTLTEHQQKWIEKKLKTDNMLFLEPKLNKVAEFGIQWDVPKAGEPSLFGFAQLKSDQRGQYLGSIVGFDMQTFPELDEIIHQQLPAIYEIQQLGYFGPVGIDAMIYLDQNGERKFRPLQDINARWTMGRLAIHWAKRLFSGDSPVCWTHLPTAPNSSAIKTSPDTVGGKPTRHLTWCYQVEELHD